MSVLNISIEDGQPAVTSLKSLIKEVGKIKINTRLSGSYFNFKNFLTGLENNIKVMDVVEIDMDGINDFGENVIYNLVIETYYQK